LSGDGSGLLGLLQSGDELVAALIVTPTCPARENA